MVPEGLGLARFNQLPAAQAEAVLRHCCASRRWCELLAAGRPYPSAAAVLSAADAALAGLAESDIDEALAGHPRIGQLVSGADAQWSRREQQAVAGASERTAAALAAGNAAYEARFGHVYLVCATGRTAGELLAMLRQRLGNDPATERAVVRRELAGINRIRLRRLLATEAA